jgi:hypothetical protein
MIRQAGCSIGLILLVGGAEALVKGASRLAVSVGVSPLVIGLTVVAFGTSAPEMAVSTVSALSGHRKGQSAEIAERVSRKPKGSPKGSVRLNRCFPISRGWKKLPPATSLARECATASPISDFRPLTSDLCSLTSDFCSLSSDF